MGSNYPQESWNNWLYDSCLMALLASMYVLLIYFVVFWRGPKIVDPKSPSFEKGLYEENSLNQKNSHDIPPNNLKTCIFFVRKEPTTQDTIMFFVLEQNVFQSQKKDVCGVPKWRIIYYFRSLKIVQWLALHPIGDSQGFTNKLRKRLDSRYNKIQN